MTSRQKRYKKRGILPIVLLAFVLICTSAAATWVYISMRDKNAETSTVSAPLQEESDRQQDVPERAEDTPKEDPEITIAFSGDTMFDWNLRPVIEQKGADFPFQYVKSDIESADYAFTNLETVFTNRNEKAPGQLYWIKSEPSALQAIKNTGFDIVSLGNNHSIDYGRDGLLDSINHVEKLGLPYIGVGRNAAEAYEAKEVTIKGKKFKFLAFVRFMPDANWVATASQPGVAGGYDLNIVTDTIKKQKGDADYLIVYMHWGVEKTNKPAAYQKEYTAQMVAAGADAIVGSHPHWLQGFEYYDEVPVAYSLGNFLFPDYVTGRSAETGVLKITFKGEDKNMSFVPYVIRSNQIHPLEGQEKQNMYQYLQSISYDVSITSEGNIENNRQAQ